MKLLTLILLSLGLVACDSAIFSSNNSNGNKAAAVNPNDPVEPGPDGEIPNLTFLDDSFEREDLFGDLDAGMIVGWRGAWDDHGTLGIGFTGNQLGMEIFSDQEMGPAAIDPEATENERATYFYGRPGSSIHRLWLISPSYDLSDYNSAIMSFRQLTVALNDQMDIDANYIEGIKLQVCMAGANACGANADFIDINNIGNDANWRTLENTISDVNQPDDALDGTNHLASDYFTMFDVVDLNDPEYVSDKSEVIFRFEVDIRDGFANGTTTGGNPDHDEEKCEKYTKKKKRYCDKAEHKCAKAEKYRNKCNDEDDDHHYGTSTLMTQTSSCNDDHHGHSYACKKAKRYERYCEHYTNKCEKYTNKKEKYCDKGETTTTAGTMVDGVILDLVQGIATIIPKDELF